MQDKSVLNGKFTEAYRAGVLHPIRPFPGTPHWYRIAVETMIQRAKYTYRDRPAHPIDVDITLQPGSRLFASIYGSDGAPVIMRLWDWRRISPVLPQAIGQVHLALESLPGLIDENLDRLIAGLTGNLPDEACIWPWFLGNGADPNPIAIDRDDLKKVRALLAWAHENITSSSLAPLLDEPDLLYDTTPSLIASIDSAMEWHEHYSPYWLAEARKRSIAAYNRRHLGVPASVDELSESDYADYVDPDQARRDWFDYLAKKENERRRARADQ